MSYYPTKIELETLPNKLYLLTWEQGDSSKQKLLTKSSAITFVNSNEHYIGLRECLTYAFKEGVIK